MSLRLGVYASSKPIIGGVQTHRNDYLLLLGNRENENKVDRHFVSVVLGAGPDVNRVEHQNLLIVVVP